MIQSCKDADEEMPVHQFALESFLVPPTNYIFNFLMPGTVVWSGNVATHWRKRHLIIKLIIERRGYFQETEVYFFSMLGGVSILRTTVTLTSSG